ncbi:hypothetical protein SISNIDRAFT_468369 [Sistotremastrum niveocremeum HHB9708]|uniref:Uncharacterized protein n=1 Tax=Sistotremastrum niveocremeum HHB9708 TaxID=1314777 RepID=A0A164RIL0_9AGAM|nr:hypothetical protein SISNIDRAFT_468369 [Sistotremastrum niveocremeum HHB9708]
MSNPPPCYSPIDPVTRRRPRPLPKPLFIRPPTPWDAGTSVSSTPSSPLSGTLPELVPTPFPMPDVVPLTSSTSFSVGLADVPQPDRGYLEALEDARSALMRLNDDVAGYEISSRRIQESIRDVISCMHELQPQVAEYLSSDSSGFPVSSPRPSPPSGLHRDSRRGIIIRASLRDDGTKAQLPDCMIKNEETIQGPSMIHSDGCHIARSTQQENLSSSLNLTYRGVKTPWNQKEYFLYMTTLLNLHIRRLDYITVFLIAFRMKNSS